jgi:P4 family phage/plasmid primase-like protien
VTDSPLSSDTGSTPDPVSSILKALGGRPVLLPIPVRHKGPFFDGWQTLTWADTENPDHPLTWSKENDAGGRDVFRTGTYGGELARVRHEGGNVGVLLGAASRSVVALTGVRYVLVSIDIDSDEGMEAFLALNPGLGRTLRTRGRRGGNLWLWVQEDGYHAATRKIFHAAADGTPDKKAPWGEWRADGGQTVIYGIHPDGMRYERVGEARSPLTISFGEIRWPEGLVLPWRLSPAEQLEADHGKPYKVTEKGEVKLNQPYFCAKYAQEHHTLYEPDEGRFYQYDAKRGLWVKVSKDHIVWDLAKDFKKMADEAKLPQLLLLRTDGMLRQLVNMLQGTVEKRSAFRREAGLIHLRNCMLDLRDGDMKVHNFSPHFYSRNQIPVDFSPEATCPRFQNDLIASALSEQDADLLQRWAGALLLGPNIMQRFMLFYGTAGGGKSTLAALIRRMVGEENCTQMRTKHLEERFEMSFYVGKQMLIAPDVNGDFLQEDGAHVIKALVGGDPLSAERKQGGEPFQITGDFHVLITCNSRLLINLQGDADAYRRRMIPLLWERPKPKKRDPDLLNHLFASESSGILNWMLAGAERVLEEKKTAGDFILAPVHQERIDSLLAESDSVRHFIQHGVAEAPGSDVTGNELLEAYTAYCESKGWRAVSLKRAGTAVADAVSEFYHLSPRGDIKRTALGEDKPKQQRGYKGLRIVPLATPGAAESQTVGAATDVDEPAY